MSTSTRIVLSNTIGDAPALTGGTRFSKDVIRTGRWWVPGAKRWLEVTPEKMDRWVETFNTMKRRGVGVNLTVDHRRSADAKRGVITGLRRDGDTLFADGEVNDGDSLALIKRVGDVSIEVDSNIADGFGNTYDEALTAVSVCQNPVVPGQSPFRIAASRDGDEVVIEFAQPADDRLCDDDVIRLSVGRYAGTLLFSSDVSPGMDRLRQALDVANVTQANALDRIVQVLNDLNSQLGKAAPPFELSADELKSLGDLLGVDVTPSNWLDMVEKRVRDLRAEVAARKPNAEYYGSPAMSMSLADQDQLAEERELAALDRRQRRRLAGVMNAFDDDDAIRMSVNTLLSVTDAGDSIDRLGQILQVAVTPGNALDRIVGVLGDLYTQLGKPAPQLSQNSDELAALSSLLGVSVTASNWLSKLNSRVTTLREQVQAKKNSGPAALSRDDLEAAELDALAERTRRFARPIGGGLALSESEAQDTADLADRTMAFARELNAEDARKAAERGF